MTVDDAHSLVRNALKGSADEYPGLYEVRLADLNDDEMDHLSKAISALERADEALAVRSSLRKVNPPHKENVNGGGGA